MTAEVGAQMFTFITQLLFPLVGAGRSGAQADGGGNGATVLGGDAFTSHMMGDAPAGPQAEADRAERGPMTVLPPDGPTADEPQEPAQEVAGTPDELSDSASVAALPPAWFSNRLDPADLAPNPADAALRVTDKPLDGLLSAAGHPLHRLSGAPPMPLPEIAAAYRAFDAAPNPPAAAHVAEGLLQGGADVAPQALPEAPHALGADEMPRSAAPKAAVTLHNIAGDAMRLASPANTASASDVQIPAALRAVSSGQAPAPSQQAAAQPAPVSQWFQTALGEPARAAGGEGTPLLPGPGLPSQLQVSSPDDPAGDAKKAARFAVPADAVAAAERPGSGPLQPSSPLQTPAPDAALPNAVARSGLLPPEAALPSRSALPTEGLRTTLSGAPAPTVLSPPPLFAQLGRNAPAHRAYAGAERASQTPVHHTNPSRAASPQVPPAQGVPVAALDPSGVRAALQDSPVSRVVAAPGMPSRVAPTVANTNADTAQASASAPRLVGERPRFAQFAPPAAGSGPLQAKPQDTLHVTMVVGVAAAASRPGLADMPSVPGHSLRPATRVAQVQADPGMPSPTRVREAAQPAPKARIAIPAERSAAGLPAPSSPHGPSGAKPAVQAGSGSLADRVSAAGETAPADRPVALQPPAKTVHPAAGQRGGVLRHTGAQPVAFITLNAARLGSADSVTPRAAPLPPVPGVLAGPRNLGVDRGTPPFPPAADVAARPPLPVRPAPAAVILPQTRAQPDGEPIVNPQGGAAGPAKPADSAAQALLTDRHGPLLPQSRVSMPDLSAAGPDRPGAGRVLAPLAQVLADATRAVPRPPALDGAAPRITRPASMAAGTASGVVQSVSDPSAGNLPPALPVRQNAHWPAQGPADLSQVPVKTLPGQAIGAVPDQAGRDLASWQGVGRRHHSILGAPLGLRNPAGLAAAAQPVVSRGAFRAENAQHPAAAAELPHSPVTLAAQPAAALQSTAALPHLASNEPPEAAAFVTKLNHRSAPAAADLAGKPSSTGPVTFMAATLPVKPVGGNLASHDEPDSVWATMREGDVARHVRPSQAYHAPDADGGPLRDVALRPLTAALPESTSPPDTTGSRPVLKQSDLPHEVPLLALPLPDDTNTTQPRATLQPAPPLQAADEGAPALPSPPVSAPSLPDAVPLGPASAMNAAPLPPVPAGPPAPLPPALPVVLAETARVLSDATVELALAPEELGRLRMTVSTDGDAIRVTLHAERPETLDLLRRHADDLRQEFRQAGFGFTSFRFGEWEGTPATEPAPAPEETEPPPLPPAADAARASPASGLDLRL